MTSESGIAALRPPRDVRTTTEAVVSITVIGVLTVASGVAAAVARVEPHWTWTLVILAVTFGIGTLLLLVALARQRALLRNGTLVFAEVSAAGSAKTGLHHTVDVLVALRHGRRTTRYDPWKVVVEFDPPRGERVKRSYALDGARVARCFPEGLRPGARVLVVHEPHRPDRAQVVRLLGMARLRDIPEDPPRS